ncbi:MAG: Aminodeoxychorismate synthase component 1 [Phycisphaerae bacterium]|nr:Aminodeoxychorismate synthase component 1 [Phycisphaerae bacterium]
MVQKFTGSQQPSVEQLLLQLRTRPGLVALESLLQKSGYGRWSVVSFEPSFQFSCQSQRDADPFTQLESLLPALPVKTQPVPFCGGWLGYIGYECGGFLEAKISNDINNNELPLAWWGWYDQALLFDHQQKCWWVVAADIDPSFRDQPVSDRIALLIKELQAAAQQSIPAQQLFTARFIDQTISRGQYIDQVHQLLAHIRAGDIYQANLTLRRSYECAVEPFDIYRRLRITNPGDYAAFIDGGEWQVLSSSPELFLQLRGSELITRPIKGTRPRAADLLVDQHLRNELLASQKDLAELAMIIDLERNDLHRVCERVMVSWPPDMESFATVHHLVATVRGEVKYDHREQATGNRLPAVDSRQQENNLISNERRASTHAELFPEWRPAVRSAVDILRATFPGGSITGCPKIRAMQILQNLEPVPRGPYCGAIGYLSVDGQMCLNVAIRTMTVKNRLLHLHTGGGIVADSDPETEYNECLAKLSGLTAALGVSEDSP